MVDHAVQVGGQVVGPKGVLPERPLLVLPRPVDVEANRGTLSHQRIPRRGDATLGRSIETAQLEQARDSRHPGQVASESTGNNLVRRRESSSRLHPVNDAVQPLIEVLNPGKVVEDALIDAKRAGRQGRSRSQLDETPMAKRRGRDDRAPVGLVEQAERHPERRSAARSVALSTGAEGGDRGVQLDPRAEKKEISFERRETKGRFKRLQSRRRRKGGRGCLQFPLELRLCWAVALVAAVQPPLQARPKDAQGRHQVALVCLRPGRRLRAHVTVTTGATYWLKVLFAWSVSTTSALSAPSTRKRRG